MPSINSLTSRMRDIAEKNTIPSNVTEMLTEAAEKLEDGEEELSVRVNTAGSILDQVSNDPNIKQHTRTEIWNLASKVESLED
ncbi:UPF0147 family protein [Candidatus Nanohalococcus occultus]|uniref:UPF0147 family protein n=1 Tax=Candidatus Nanohalococcus occultus TaxID=2978047 RepID=UPI0039DFB480